MKGDRDFTMEKYEDLCGAILDEGYAIYTVLGYLHDRPKGRFVVLRHDIDIPPLARPLTMARLEDDLGIRSTYYVRFVGGVFKRNVIRDIYNLGHEVGYHYEVLSKACGDYERAIELFEHELQEFNSICDVKTICMHGSPASKYDNRTLWGVYDFTDFGIEGEAYLSVRGVHYFSDTGRSWSWKNKVRDAMPGMNPAVCLDTTDDLIAYIRERGSDTLYLTVHPDRWALSNVGWACTYLKDCAYNAGKRILATVRG